MSCLEWKRQNAKYIRKHPGAAWLLCFDKLRKTLLRMIFTRIRTIDVAIKIICFSQAYRQTCIINTVKLKKLGTFISPWWSSTWTSSRILRFHCLSGHALRNLSQSPGVIQVQSILSWNCMYGQKGLRRHKPNFESYLCW